MAERAQSVSGILQSTLRFASGTVLSRVSGLLRDMSMAFCFGTTPEIAAFLVAFRLANLLRRIFGEGALLNGFIPHFESCRSESPKQASQFFRDLFFSVTLLLLFLIGIIELALYSGLHYALLSTENQQILWLTMLMLPGVLFICLFSLCSGLLQCENHFFLTGFAPVAFNIIWIAAVWMFRDYPHQEAIIGLAIAITYAFFFQWFITMPNTLTFLRMHLSWKEMFHCHFFSAELRKMLGAISFGILGVSAVQINSAIDTIFARYASLEGPAYLNYAIHIQQLPLALFAIGVSSVLLPSLSRTIKSTHIESYGEHLSHALSLTLTFLLPCAMGIFVIGGASVNLLYGRGDFTEQSTLQTTWCLWGYGIGLIPMGIALLLSSAFYAKKDYWTPMIASLISIGVNLSLNTLLVCVLQHGPTSLALSTSLAACANAGILWWQLTKNHAHPILPSFQVVSRLTIATLIAGGFTLGIECIYFNGITLNLLFSSSPILFPRDPWIQLSYFLLLSSGFFAMFFLFRLCTKSSLCGLILKIKSISALLKK